MLKIVSKIDCTRCENIKNYLSQRQILFDVEMAEDKGYGYWRDYIAGTTGKLGFPLLIHNDGETTGHVNGSNEEIIEQIDQWFPTEKVEVKIDPNTIENWRKIFSWWGI